MTSLNEDEWGMQTTRAKDVEAELIERLNSDNGFWIGDRKVTEARSFDDLHMAGVGVFFLMSDGTSFELAIKEVK